MSDNWISVEDSLPEHLKAVLCVHLYPFVDEDYAICYLSSSGVWCAETENLEAENYDGGATIGLTHGFNPTHWQPLPEPPK